MSLEETIPATLDANGEPKPSQPSHLPPGSVEVTIRIAGIVFPRRGLSDVVRESAAEQRARFPWTLGLGD